MRRPPQRSLALWAALTTLAACTTLAPVDLSTWVTDGAGTWTLETLNAANDTVVQTANTDPGVFFDPTAQAQGRALGGTITVTDTGDDDFIGFVLGYTPGAITAQNTDYLLIDWKQADQDYSDLGTAKAGLSISRVTGPLREASGPWAHDPNDGVSELARARTLGTTGWDANRPYSFQIEFTATRVHVTIDGTTELDLSGTFTNGAFGFYNYSQPDVRYAGLQTRRIQTLPWWLLIGLIAIALSIRISKKLRNKP